ncbi:hypothetical protein H072_635 [Dactylellina haptotyla CBS 200.50]|uniref:Uncharacterized protein n=1 Tax=Dactylellina haptotyla (strain CBS 200.50) TaxID=1284197 RepID=S8CCL3_DACHA|nr:hypothetical protein H072_635 [Dactylellina haptotyla CBS 200.50]
MMVAMTMLNPGIKSMVRNKLKLSRPEVGDEKLQEIWKALIGTDEISFCVTMLYSYRTHFRDAYISEIQYIGMQVGPAAHTSALLILERPENYGGTEPDTTGIDDGTKEGNSPRKGKGKGRETDKGKGKENSATSDGVPGSSKDSFIDLSNYEEVLDDLLSKSSRRGELAEHDRLRGESRLFQPEAEDLLPEYIGHNFRFDLSWSGGQLYPFQYLSEKINWREDNDLEKKIENNPTYRKVHLVQLLSGRRTRTILRTSSSEVDKHFAMWWSAEAFSSSHLVSSLYQSWSIGTNVHPRRELNIDGHGAQTHTPKSNLQFVTIWNIENVETLAILGHIYKMYGKNSEVYENPLTFRLEDFDQGDMYTWYGLLGIKEVQAIADMLSTFPRGMRGARITSIEVIFHSMFSDSAELESAVKRASIFLRLTPVIDEKEYREHIEGTALEMEYNIHELNRDLVGLEIDELMLPLQISLTTASIVRNPLQKVLEGRTVYKSSENPSYHQISALHRPSFLEVLQDSFEPLDALDLDYTYKLSMSSQEKHIILNSLSRPSESETSRQISNYILSRTMGKVLFSAWFSYEGWSKVQHLTFQDVSAETASWIKEYTDFNQEDINGVTTFNNDGNKRWAQMWDDFVQTIEGNTIRSLMEERKDMLVGASVEILQFGEYSASGSADEFFILVQFASEESWGEILLERVSDLDEPSGLTSGRDNGNVDKLIGLPLLPRVFDGDSVSVDELQSLFNRGVNSLLYQLEESYLRAICPDGDRYGWKGPSHPYDPAKDDELISRYEFTNKGDITCPGGDFLRLLGTMGFFSGLTGKTARADGVTKGFASGHIKPACTKLLAKTRKREDHQIEFAISPFKFGAVNILKGPKFPSDLRQQALSEFLREIIYAGWTHIHDTVDEHQIFLQSGADTPETRGLKLITFFQVNIETEQILNSWKSKIKIHHSQSPMRGFKGRSKSYEVGKRGSPDRKKIRKGGWYAIRTNLLSLHAGNPEVVWLEHDIQIVLSLLEVAAVIEMLRLFPNAVGQARIEQLIVRMTEDTDEAVIDLILGPIFPIPERLDEISDEIMIGGGDAPEGEEDEEDEDAPGSPEDMPE